MGCGTSKQSVTSTEVPSQKNPVEPMPVPLPAAAEPEKVAAAAPTPAPAPEKSTPPAPAPEKSAAAAIVQAQQDNIFSDLKLVSLRIGGTTGWSVEVSASLRQTLSKELGIGESSIGILQYSSLSRDAQVVFHNVNWKELAANLEKIIMDEKSALATLGVVGCSGGTEDLIGGGSGVWRTPQAPAQAGDVDEEREELIWDLQNKVSDLEFEMKEQRKAAAEYVQVLEAEMTEKRTQLEDMQEELDDAVFAKDGLEFDLKKSQEATVQYVASFEEEVEQIKEQLDEDKFDLKQQIKDLTLFIDVQGDDIKSLKKALAAAKGEEYVEEDKG